MLFSPLILALKNEILKYFTIAIQDYNNELNSMKQGHMTTFYSLILI